MKLKQSNHISYIKLNLQADSNNLNYSPKNFKQKKGNQSANNIFGLPQSVLQKYKPQQKNHQKNQQKRKNNLETTIQYGQIAISYQQNLRKTILNHTKQLFQTKKRHKSFIEQPSANTLIQLDNIRSKRTKNLIQTNCNQSALNTLSILQKVIFTDNNNKYHIHQKPIFQLQSNKLPLISKQQFKRQTRMAMNANPHLWRSPSPERQNTKQSYNNVRQKPKPIQKPQICGWDEIDISDY